MAVLLQGGTAFSFCAGSGKERMRQVYADAARENSLGALVELFVCVARNFKLKRTKV